MIEALIALVLSVFIIAVFGGPSWAIKCGQFGGLGFFLYVLILVIQWAIGQAKK